jgi:hypothetical protein
MKNIFQILCIALFLIPIMATAGKKDTLRPIPDPIHKNVIKFNPTPMLLWSKKNITFSYERILNKKQSITFSLGYLEFGQLFGDTVANLVKITDRQKQGINAAVEYRFYLTKRNTSPIPDGLYIAPYLSFYGYSFSNGLEVVGSEEPAFARMDGNFYSFNLGGELGYQFVLWKRLTIDLVLVGPATSYYGGELNIKGELNGENLKNINEDLYNKVKAKYPMIDKILLNKSFKKNGTIDLLSVGYRYFFQIGFHF